MKQTLQERLDRAKFALMFKGYSEQEAENAVAHSILQYMPPHASVVYFAEGYAKHHSTDECDEDAPTLVMERNSPDTGDVSW